MTLDNFVPTVGLLDKPGERLHLWSMAVNGPLSIQRVADLEVVLSRVERVRHRRFIRATDRDLFLCAHVLLRRVLSAYCGIDEQELSFRTNEYGRPEVSNKGAPGGLRFNLSHTHGMVAVLVHDHTDSGVDVEQIGRVDDLKSMSSSVFADVERSSLFGLPEEEQEARFYRLWTLKEAFIKAKGMGLAIPLKDFWFDSEDSTAIRFGCHETVDNEPDAWSFTVRSASPDHVLATACRSGVGRPEREIDLFSVTLDGDLSGRG